MSNLRGMLQGVVILASAVVLFYLAYTYYTKKIEKESFQDYAPVSDEESADSAEPAKEPAPVMTTTVASPQQLNPSEKKNKPKGCFPKDKLTPEDRSNVEGRLAELKTVLGGDDMAAISSATEALMSASQEFSQKLYEQAAASEAGGAGAAGAGASGASTPDDDEVVDAEIVDDEEN